MHHALYIEGPLSHFDDYVAAIKPYFAEKYERFGVEDARSLIERAQLKNFGEATFLIAAASITSEAQQALLKLFEEPQPGTTFVLLVPYGTIIATLRSRMLPYPKPIQTEQGSSEAKKFLKASNKERSDFIAKMLKDEEDAKEQVRELLNGLEHELHKGLKKNSSSAAYLAALQDISKVRSYTNDRSPSLKMLMEHLALALPTLP